MHHRLNAWLSRQVESRGCRAGRCIEMNCGETVLVSYKRKCESDHRVAVEGPYQDSSDFSHCDENGEWYDIKVSASPDLSLERLDGVNLINRLDVSNYYRRFRRACVSHSTTPPDSSRQLNSTEADGL